MIMNKKVFPIRGMHCKSCEMVTEEELTKVAGVKRADTDFRSGNVTVFYEGEAPSDAALADAIHRAGYEIGVNTRAWFSRDFSSYLETSAAAVAVGVLYLIGRNQGWFALSPGSAEEFDRMPVVFLAGLAAGLSTCMAIVGGMILAVSARFGEMHPEADTRRKFVPHIFFNLGRIGGFALLGALLGALGSMMQPSVGFVGVLTAVVAAIMVLLGLQLLELFPKLSAWKLTLPKRVARLFGVQTHSQKEYSHGRAALLGALTFFLPCGFTQAVQLFVVTQGDALQGALIMGTFALGTAPGLLGIGGLSSIAKGPLGRYFFRAAGIAVIALGIFNFGNGLNLLKLGTAPSAAPETEEAVWESAGKEAEEREPQVIHMTQEADGYYPNEFTVRKGQPVQWVIDSKESYSCAVSLVAPKAGVRKVLQSGENVITFTPKAVGDIPFSCSMGMYDGIIHVIE